MAMPRASRRAKTTGIPACASCKRHKTRCEILDYTARPIRCHRCKVLSVECSYECTEVPMPTPSKVSPSRRKLETTSPSSSVDELDPVTGLPFEGPTKGRLWDFLAEEGEAQNVSVDWLWPMLAIERLTAPSIHLTTSEPCQLISDDNGFSISTILTEERKNHLLDLFNAQYTPWLNFQPIRDSQNPLVDIACTTVAARHLDRNDAAEPKVRVRLQCLAREAIARTIFHADAKDSIEAVQCLLILALWVPLGETEDGRGWGWSPETMISTAVRMAVRLRLDYASAVVKDMGIWGKVAGTSEALQRAHLWIALTNAESMLCMGTGRVVSSCRTTEDLQLVEFPRVVNMDTDWTLVRLGLISRLLNLCQEGTATRLQPGEETREWAGEITVLLERLKRDRRLLFPLPVVLGQDQVHFHAIQIYQLAARLLILYHAFRTARASVPHIPAGRPWYDHFLPPHPSVSGKALLAGWGRDLVRTTEAFLVAFLSSPGGVVGLSSAPDVLFRMTALAAGVLVGVKFFILPHALLGAGDLLLAKTATMLRNVGAQIGPGHPAARAGVLAQRWYAIWERRHATPAEAGAAARRSPTPRSDGTETPSITSATTASCESEIHDGLLPFLDMDFIFSLPMLPDEENALWDALGQQQLW